MSTKRTLPFAGVIGLLGMLAAAPAHAYCRTSTTSAPTVDGHVCTPAQKDDSGLPVFWGMPRITYSVQVDASKDIPFDTARLAIRTAFDAWTSADCEGQPPRLELIEGAPAICALDEYNKDRGNANIIFFVDEGWSDDSFKLAITTVTFDVNSGEIYDADMALNTTHWPFTTNGAPDGIDLLSVLTHEAGHFLGLNHSPDPEASMTAHYQPPEQMDMRSLAEDDRAGICAIYPPGPLADGCDATPRHGFSALCAEDQSGPVLDAPPTGERCCCLEGDTCVDGICVEAPGGCACTTHPAPLGPGAVTIPLAALVASLRRRRAAGGRRAQAPS
ncbi:matrixin family metalloprotease [Polyangium sorediatum]|uniref:Matrixin family metalloprotease n=1 Tax=Polyangium sorediatum TaxID=889274 RepID=A0ABT6P9E5_9BACT|nr:matrixin family metalloprotease [Polyangium sorediatum]MDI1437250.1 matrixin family metalloprotease [Polyangium sorediatum]